MADAALDRGVPKLIRINTRNAGDQSPLSAVKMVAISARFVLLARLARSQPEGGSIRAESPGEGHGAIFTVVLPSSSASKPGDMPQFEPTSHETPAPASLSGIRVFIVEDEPDTREFLDRFLTASGAEVLAAGTATEALAKLQECEADILVSDIGLPDMDGYELMQRVRRLKVDNYAAIPAIALTAYARSEDRTRAFRAGFQAHLAKPVEPAELLATIASFAEFIEAHRRGR